MRKPLDEMTPEELDAEGDYQEGHFQNLVSHLESARSLPKTWYGRFWRKWLDAVNTTIRIIVGTFMYLVVLSIVIAIIRFAVGV